MNSKKNKIVLFHDYFDNYGGGERLAFYFANIFGVSVHTTFISKEINKIIGLKIHRYNNHIIKYAPFIVYFPSIIKKIFVYLFFKYSKFEKINSDIIFYSGNYSLLSSKKFKCKKKILYLHSLPKSFFSTIFINEYSYAMKLFIDFVFKYYFRSLIESLYDMDLIICNSQYTKKNILAIFPIDEKKISVISPPVDFNYFNLQNIKFENYYFVSSRHEKNKRIANIIEAFKKIDSQLIISSSGSQTKFLKKISINYENIKFVGVLTENKYIHYLKNCRALVMISKDEDFGMSAVEANACGKAVICSKNGGFLEYIEDKVNGYFVDENDVISSIRNIVKKNHNIFNKNSMQRSNKVKYLEYSQFKKKLLNLLYQPL